MKKILGKTLILGVVVALAITVGATFAQFGGADGVKEIGGIAGVNTAPGAGITLLDVVKKFINRVLGLLSLIALGMALYGGFQMVTAAGDDGKYKSGFKVLKQAAIGLIVVGLSWIIVSTIFWVLGQVGAGSGT